MHSDDLMYSGLLKNRALSYQDLIASSRPLYGVNIRNMKLTLEKLGLSEYTIVSVNKVSGKTEMDPSRIVTLSKDEQVSVEVEFNKNTGVIYNVTLNQTVSADQNADLLENVFGKKINSESEQVISIKVNPGDLEGYVGIPEVVNDWDDD